MAIIGNQTNQGWWVDSAEGDKFIVDTENKEVYCDRCGSTVGIHRETRFLGDILITVKLHRDECKYLHG